MSFKGRVGVILPELHWKAIPAKSSSYREGCLTKSSPSFWNYTVRSADRPGKPVSKCFLRNKSTKGGRSQAMQDLIGKAGIFKFNKILPAQ